MTRAYSSITAYTRALPPEALRALHVLSPWRVVRDTLSHWLVIVASWVLVALWPQWWAVAIAIPVIGSQYYGLFIIGHDGLHRRLFPTVRANDLWNDVLAIGPVGAITRINRINHMRHHRSLATPDDPDRHKYISANKTLRNVFLPAGVDSAGLGNGSARGRMLAAYRPRDVAILAGWQISLGVGLGVGIGWWAYPVLWWLPLYIFTFLTDSVRVFAEHSQPSGDDAASDRLRLITYRSNVLERLLFAPHNMNFHVAHHVWPTIPYYRLPEADRQMRASRVAGDVEWRGSYLRYLLHFYRSFVCGSRGNFALRAPPPASPPPGGKRDAAGEQN